MSNFKFNCRQDLLNEIFYINKNFIVSHYTFLDRFRNFSNNYKLFWSIKKFNILSNFQIYISNTEFYSLHAGTDKRKVKETHFGFIFRFILMILVRNMHKPKNENNYGL